jgi:hypothetical protein
VELVVCLEQFLWLFPGLLQWLDWCDVGAVAVAILNAVFV